MTDFGIYASRLQISNQYLKGYENALRYFRKQPEDTPENQVQQYNNIIRSVLGPIAAKFHGTLSNSLEFDDRDVIEILKNRHLKNWPTYKQEIINLSEKFKKDSFLIQENDLILLNDVADAMETICSKLSRRMERFP